VVDVTPVAVNLRSRNLLSICRVILEAPNEMTLGLRGGSPFTLTLPTLLATKPRDRRCSLIIRCIFRNPTPKWHRSPHNMARKSGRLVAALWSIMPYSSIGRSQRSRCRGRTAYW